jgi:hypothetical protein
MESCRMLLALFTVLLTVALGLVPAKCRSQTSTTTQRTIYLAGKLSDEDTIAFTSAVAASDPNGIVLLDTPNASPHLLSFVEAYQPSTVIAVGSLANGGQDLERRLGVRPTAIWPTKIGLPDAFWKQLFPHAHRVVVCSAEPRGLLLQAASFAGAIHAPLIILHPGTDRTRLGRRLREWHTREVFAIGTTAAGPHEFEGFQVIELKTEEAVISAYLRAQRKSGPIRTLVVCNPADVRRQLGHTSALAPWIALRHRAALLCTNEAGANTAAVVRNALENPDLARSDTLLLAAGLEALPMDRRPNPVPGKDAFIEMEPLTPTGEQPFSFATGRLFQEDLGVLALVLARQELVKDVRRPRKALLVSNPGGGLALLETFSRNTALEFRNCGYETTALFQNDVNREGVRRLLPEQDIFLWEGHYRTLVDHYGLPQWTESLRPALIFLQSCLALNQVEAQPFLQRGAIGIVGSSTRTYSGTGGAFTLAFFDALLYEGESLGGSLRHAKNFLLAYSLLKEKRLGENAKLGGANLRSAWAFSLWGDPTLRLPQPAPVDGGQQAVRHEVQGREIVLTIPDTAYPRVSSERFHAQMWPNARLAGLVSPEINEDERRLVPFLFAEVSLPHGPREKTPHLSSRLPSSRWVFCWDERRRSGYLLAVPRWDDRGEIRFHIRWDD